MAIKRITYVCAILLAITISGCDDEPTCDITTVLAGGYNGAIDWSLSGRDSCGIANPTNVAAGSSALAFVDRTSAVTQNLYVLPHTPALAVGTFPAQVLFFVGDNFWDSGEGNCSVTITSRELENWTRIDFVAATGTVECDGPLISASPEHEDITLSPGSFSVHLHAEVLSFDYL